MTESTGAFSAPNTKEPTLRTTREVLDSLSYEIVDHDEDVTGGIHFTSDLDGSGFIIRLTKEEIEVLLKTY